MAVPVVYAGAAAVVVWMAARAWRERGWEASQVWPGMTLAAVAALFGARLHGAMIPWDAFAEDPLAALGSGRLSSFGGFVLGWVALATYYVGRRGHAPGEVEDALAPMVPVLYAILKLGCFLNGDDYGPPSSLPWALAFPEGAPPTSVTVHPAQLYEILLMGAVFAWLWSRRGLRRPRGALAFEMLAAMGAARFTVEFWRLGAVGPAGLTWAQWFSLALVVGGGVGRLRLARRGPAGPLPTATGARVG